MALYARDGLVLLVEVFLLPVCGVRFILVDVGAFYCKLVSQVLGDFDFNESRA